MDTESVFLLMVFPSVLFLTLGVSFACSIWVIYKNFSKDFCEMVLGCLFSDLKVLSALALLITASFYGALLLRSPFIILALVFQTLGVCMAVLVLLHKRLSGEKDLLQQQLQEEIQMNANRLPDDAQISESFGNVCVFKRKRG